MYVHRPVANRPELMPLDKFLNNDIQSALSLHCAITTNLDDDDIRKFSFSTPSTNMSEIRHIYNNGTSSNVPSSRHIVQDCRKVLRTFRIVYENNGGMMPGISNMSGHRNVAEGMNTAGWGGVWIKNLLIAEIGRWLHADAVKAKNSRKMKLLYSLLKSIII